MTSGARVQEPGQPDMPADCIEELKASEQRETHKLLTANDSDILRCDDFSSINRLITVVILVLKFCSLLRSKSNHAWLRVMREESLNDC